MSAPRLGFAQKQKQKQKLENGTETRASKPFINPTVELELRIVGLITVYFPLRAYIHTYIHARRVVHTHAYISSTTHAQPNDGDSGHYNGKAPAVDFKSLHQRALENIYLCSCI